ncbi:MAG: hypothetical protein GXP29_14785, partial [Planctomycetes bacterium]|nr:hypothetical protein [Planctomycetota bacterium]
MFVLCALTGCLGPPKTGPDMFASADVFGAPRGANPISETPLYDSSTQTIHLAGAVNEVLGFYLRVGGSGRLNVAVQDFVSDSNHRLADNVDVFRIHHVQPPRFPGWYVKRMEPSRRPKTVPDVLVPAHAPRGGLPTEVGRSRPVELWIDVRLPKGTPPGDYESKVVVTASGKAISKLPIKLTIWPFVLPDNAGPEFVVDVDHEALFAHHVMLDGRPYHPPRVLEGSPKRRELAETITSTMRLLREHGLSPHLPKLYPVAKIDAKQNMQVDWADYDSLVSGFLDGS